MASLDEKREDAGAADDASDAGAADDADAQDGGAEDEAPEPEPPAPAQGFGAWLRGAPLPRSWHLGLGLVLPALVLLGNAWRVRSFTIDDAYISYRYARNFARGLGLVYNEGERIEGYTNFLWTVLLAGGIRIGLDPDVLAKILGALSGVGALGAIWLLSNRIRPFTTVPCFATWLYASSIVATGYAVFGLETSLFVFLVLAGTELLFRERDRGAGFPWSGVVFALAGLTRPEAPAFLGIPMLFLGFRRFFGWQNLLRGAVFVAPIALHMIWRRLYYGTWIVNTAEAKTGNLSQQFYGGLDYLRTYALHSLPVLFLALFGLCVAIVARHRDALCVAVLSFFVGGYILLVGGDWMPFFRFLAPFEPFCFILACLGARSLLEPAFAAVSARIVRHARGAAAIAAAAAVAVLACVVALGVFRSRKLGGAQHKILRVDKVFWDTAAGGAADWLNGHGKPGEVALGDIGYVGYATDYPILDLLGLVDPVISKLPGGYTRKTGPGYVQRIFDKFPRYFVFIGTREGCEKMVFPAQEKVRRDRRFQRAYDLAGKVRHAHNGYWCIFERREGAPHPSEEPQPGARPPPRRIDIPPE